MSEADLGWLFKSDPKKLVPNFHCNRSYKHRKTITDIVFCSENKILSPEKSTLAASENTFVLIFCHFQRLSLYDISSSKTTSIQNNRTRIIWRPPDNTHVSSCSFSSCAYFDVREYSRWLPS